MSSSQSNGGSNPSFLYNPSSFRSFSSISPRNKRTDGSEVKGDSDTVPITIKDSSMSSSFRSTNYSSLYGSKSGSVDKPVTSTFSTFKYASFQDKIIPKTRVNDQTNGTVTDASIQNKRELFFRNESTPTSVSNGPAVTTTSNSVSNHVPASTTASVPLITTTKDSLFNKDSKLDYVKSREHSNDEKLKEKEKVVPRKTRTIEGYVGFASLPNQVYRRAVKKGFEFNLMVVGESGLGKSTLINSMFLSDIYSSQHPGPSFRIKKTVQVETIKVLLKENGVNLTLTVVDTPGFGDAVDNSNCWQPIIDYIENKCEEYLNGESRVNRKTVCDNRVHSCLYFIAPSGHGLKPLDVEFMKKLHDKVNVIPLLAKADTMTPDECASFKKQILSEIQQHKIKIYEFPDCLDEEENKILKPLRQRVPFAVVGSNSVLEIDGKKVRGRKYPWGVVDVENMDHCDFIPLRNILIRTHMQDLKDVTSNVHYENYRCRKLAGVSSDKTGRIPNKNPLAQMEEERKEHELTMKKMEQEMEQVFEMKVKEKQQKLKDSEVELQKHHEQMRLSLEAQERELQQRREQFDREVRKWEESNNVSLEELRRKHLEAISKDSVDGKDKSKKKKGLF